jgi:hypothetical protein
MERGSKLLTASEKQRLDKMFTKVIVQAYMQVQQVPNDTDLLMWWKQYQQEFPDLSRMARQYLAVPATSSSPERFFSRVGLVQTDLCGRILETTMLDLMWTKQTP